MVDLLDDLDARRRRDRVPAELAALIVVRLTGERVSGRARALGNVDCGDLEVVLRLT